MYIYIYINIYIYIYINIYIYIYLWVIISSQNGLRKIYYAKQRIEVFLTKDTKAPPRIALAAPMQFGMSARRGSLAPGTRTDPSLAWPAPRPSA